MPKKIPTLELDAISSLVQQYPLGIEMDRLREGLGFSLPERTMQRRVKSLEEEGKITSKGTGKGKRYFPAEKIMPIFVPPPSSILMEAAPDYGSIPLSPAAREILNIVRSPLVARVPVGYNAEFLASYFPNETEYLDRQTRAELARLGQVGIYDLPAGTYIREVLDRLLIDLSWNSSRLEGNTYSLLETELLLARGEGAAGRNDEETQMILNHKAAIEMLAEQAGEIGFNRYTICNLHALLSDNLLSDPAACGRLRCRPVLIGGTVFHPLEVPQRIEACFLEILAKAEVITDPFEQAFFAMVHLPYLQPFEDVNKRVSRLSANIPLVRYNLCPLSFIDVPQDIYISGLIGVYELNRIDLLRDVFIWAYRRSASRYSAVLQSLGDPDPFRLRYRAQIGEAVREVVEKLMEKGRAAQWIEKNAFAKISEADRHRFVEVVETELLSLHEGNIARYRLRPGEFSEWKAGWG